MSRILSSLKPVDLEFLDWNFTKPRLLSVTKGTLSFAGRAFLCHVSRKQISNSSGLKKRLEYIIPQNESCRTCNPVRHQQGRCPFHSGREAGREFSVSHQAPLPIILSAQFSAICGLICSPEPGSTSLAKADAKTSHYHDYFGSRLNPFTEDTFILFLAWVFIHHVCWNKMSRVHVYEYQDTYSPDANLIYFYPF